MPTVRSRSYLALPPGVYILEQMDIRHMPFDEFAEQAGIRFSDATRLLNGDIEMTPEFAKKLEKLFDIPVYFWHDMEQMYREELAKAEAENAAEDAKRMTTSGEPLILSA